MSEDKKSGAVSIEISRSTIIAIVLAILGFAWNKYEATIESALHAQTRTTQNTTYELTRAEVDRLWRAIEDLEEDLERVGVFEEPIRHDPHPQNEVLESLRRRKQMKSRRSTLTTPEAEVDVLLGPPKAKNANRTSLPEYGDVQELIKED